MRFGSFLAGKRKPRPGLGVGPFSPKQPAARRRRWRWAHFGTTSLKACPFAACLSFGERCLLFFTVGWGWLGRWFWWPFLGLCVTEDVYSLTAYPAGGHFLVRQKVTKERPGLRPGPDGQRRQSLGGRSPNAAWTAWARFFCLGDSLNLNVWLLDAWLGGWPCWGTGSSSLVGEAIWPAPSFRLA